MKRKPKLNDVYQIVDKSEMTTIERLDWYLLNPNRHHVSDRDLQYLGKLQIAFSIMSEDYTILGRINRVLALCDITTRVQAKNIIRDASELFAPIMERNKELELYYQLERLHVQLASIDGIDVDSNYLKVDIEKLIMKLNDKLESKGASLPNFPKTITFSSDPSLLDEG